MEPIRIMIVEDDPMVMEVNCGFVSKVDGFEVTGKASTAAEALAAIGREKPDLLLLDYFLPDQDGLAVLKEIRRCEWPVDVILLTANRSPSHIQEILRCGALDYILKPFRFDRIRVALEQYRYVWCKLRGDQPLEQSDMDQIMGLRMHSVRPAADHPLPKGLNPHTLQQILQYLSAQKEAQSAEEVAQGTGLARVTARRYLEYLHQKGNVQLEIQYGSIGRPINRYRL